VPYCVDRARPVTLLFLISEPQESDHDYQPMGGTGKFLKLFTSELNRSIDIGIISDNNNCLKFAFRTRIYLEMSVLSRLEFHLFLFWG
jgi:hypothetical protein